MNSSMAILRKIFKYLFRSFRSKRKNARFTCVRKCIFHELSRFQLTVHRVQQLCKLLVGFPQLVPSFDREQGRVQRRVEIGTRFIDRQELARVRKRLYRENRSVPLDG